MPRRSNRKFSRDLRPYADAYLLAFGAQQFFNAFYVPDEYAFHARVMDALKVDRRSPMRMRKYFHSMDIRMGKLRPDGPLSSQHRGKRVDIQMEKFWDCEHPREPITVPPRQVGKSQALGAMYGSNPNVGSVTWWSSLGRSDLMLADEAYRMKFLNR